MVPWQGSVTQTIKELQLRRLPDGTVVFPPSVTAPPTNAKFNDVWFKKNGNSTELWIFEKQDDGSGKWIRKDLSDDEIKKKVADAQQGLNQAKADIINNKQKADADIENLNKSIEVNKKVADESLKKLNDSVTNLQGRYDNNIVPNLNKVMADASDALQKYISAQNSIADLAKQAQKQGKDIADVTNTVKGLNINYANLAGDVNSTKVDVKGLQTTVGTANGDIAQLKLDAQNLQTMLAGKVDNTTYTNFINLTNQALNARLTASDLNGYAKTADVQATANGLRVDVNSVTDRMNNLKVGGRNLLIGTSEDEKSGKAYEFADYQISGGLQPNKTYTLSGWARVDQNSLNHHQYVFVDAYSEDWSWSASLNINASLAAQYNKLTFTTPNGKQLHPHVTVYLSHPDGGTNENNNDAISGVAFIKKLKLEEGNFATDWTPAPNDLATQSAFSELSQSLEGLRSTVGSNYGSLQSQISQTAKNIRQEVSDKTNGLQTQITQQSNNFNVSLNSLRKETAWQKVTSAIDANNYKTTGNYWIQATPNSNTPDSSAWAYLQVVASPDAKRIKQTWQRDNNENEIYTRLLIEDNWTSWQRTVTGGNIMAQINMSAGTTLIQNDKIYMDASSTIFSGNAFIPSAAITSLTADKITAGTINGAKVNVINLNANNITAGTLRGSNGEFYLDSGALHVWQNNHDAWIDQNGIHDYDNQGNNVWISRGAISAYGNSSGAYLFDGGLYLHKSQSLSDAVLDPDYGSITKSDNIVSFGTSGLDIEGKDGFLLRTHGWNDQTLFYLNGNEIIGAGIAGKSDGFINIAAKKQLFLYAGEPIQNNSLKTIPNLVLDGTYQNGQTVLKGTFSQYFFQGPSSGFSGGIILQDEFVNVGSLNGKNYFSINSDGAITITANGKSILSLNGLFPGVNSDFNVRGNFAVTGSKNAIVPTSRGMAAINAYETAEYYFGDIGEAVTNSDGKLTVMIDPFFLETVNTVVPYQVFLTSYGGANVWIASRSANCFVVKSSKPNIHFAWEIKAKRKGYENDRMEIVKGVNQNE